MVPGLESRVCLEPWLNVAGECRERRVVARDKLGQGGWAKPSEAFLLCQRVTFIQKKQMGRVEESKNQTQVLERALQTHREVGYGGWDWR